MFRCILKLKKNRGKPLKQFTVSVRENFCEFCAIPTRLPSTLLEVWV